MRLSSTGTSTGSGTARGDVGSPRTSRRFLGKERRRIAQKIPFLLHPSQLTLERQDFFITSDAGARKRFLAVRVQFTTPTEQQARSNTQILSDLAHVGTRLLAQTDCLAFEFFAELSSLLHDTPPALS